MADVETQRNSQISASEMSGLSDEEDKQTEASGLPLPLILVCAIAAIAFVGNMMCKNSNDVTVTDDQKVPDETDENPEDEEEEQQEAAVVPIHKKKEAWAACAALSATAYGAAGYYQRWLFCGFCPQSMSASEIEFKSEAEFDGLFKLNPRVEPWATFKTVGDRNNDESKTLRDALFVGGGNCAGW